MRIGSTVATLALAALLVPAAEAQVHESGRSMRGHVGENNVLRFQLARTTLRGEGDYWPDKEFDFTATADDFEELSFTFDYQRLLTNRLSLMVSVSVFEASEDQAYWDFVDDFGNDIVHRTTLERGSLSAGIVVHPFGRDVFLSPYVGAGVGYYGWRIKEAGDFIDFGVFPEEIFFDVFADEGDAFGHYWLAGLEVPLGWSWAAFIEARWQRVDQDLGGDFVGFGSLDLSSRDVGVGLSVGF